MNLYTAAIGLSVLGSFGGVIAASTFLLLGDSIRVKVIPWAISYAVGTLLGVAVLALLPQALERLPATRALATLLFGVLAFFLLEKLVLWRHCHTEDCESHHVPDSNRRDRAAGWIVLIGDGVHNAFDGVLIAAAFLSRRSSAPTTLTLVFIGTLAVAAAFVLGVMVIGGILPTLTFR